MQEQGALLKEIERLRDQMKEGEHHQQPGMSSKRAPYMLMSLP